jgi:hypothetical protein
MALLPVDVAPSDRGLLNVRSVTRLSPPAAYSGRSMIGRYAAGMHGGAVLNSTGWTQLKQPTG